MTVAIHTGDCRDVLRKLPAESVHCCVTSPPYYGLRDYGVEPTKWPAVQLSTLPGLPSLQVPAMKCCLGMEPDPWAFVGHLVQVFREVRRVLRDDGTLWLNIGDSYAANRGSQPADLGSNSTLSGCARAADGHGRKVPDGYKPKDLIGIPWMLAFALRADGWYLRQEIIWNKRNPMPESVRDRCTKAHESLFLLSKSPRYYFDAAAIVEESVEPRGPGNIRPVRALPGERETGDNANVRGSLHKIGARAVRNKRSVWSVATQPFSEAHFATFPVALIEPCILAGSPAGGVVLDPFGGAGTTGVAAENLGRDSLLIELNPQYADIAARRTQQGGLALGVMA